MNIILLVIYITLSTGGAALIKLGGQTRSNALFSVPYFNFDISATTLVGILGYGLSFLLFIVLLNKLDLSYLTPVATGVSYAALMAISIIVFNEDFSVAKVIGCIFILIGVILVVASSTRLA